MLGSKMENYNNKDHVETFVTTLESQSGVLVRATLDALNVEKIHGSIDGLGHISFTRERFVVERVIDYVSYASCHQRKIAESPIEGSFPKGFSASSVKMSSFVIPIIYQDNSLGRLFCEHSPDDICNIEHKKQFLALLGRELAFQTTRYRILEKSRRMHHKDCVILGSSPSIREVEVQIE